MMKKRYILIALVLMFVVTFFVMSDDEVQIGVYIYDMTDFYMINYMSHLTEDLSEVGELYVHDAKNSQILQNEAIVENIDKQDILIVNPVDRLSAYALIELAKLKEKTIIFINREPLPNDLFEYENAYYVGSEAIQSAKFQADLISDLFGGNPNSLNEVDKNGDGKVQLIIFKGQRGHQDAENRTEYLQIFLSNMGYEIDLVSIENGEWFKQESKNLMEEILLDNVYAEVIACNNDYMALGVVEAIDEFESTDVPYHVVGIDGMKEAIEAINEGKMYGTVYNDAALQASEVTKLVKNKLDTTYNFKPPKYIWVDYTELSRENMDQLNKVTE